MNKNRGMFLESLINRTISFYSKNDLCIIHKKNLDITFKTISRNQNKLEVKSGYVSRKSTVDYYGIYKGVFIAFEAKSTNLDKLPLNNIQEHQSEYLKSIKKHGGLAFYIIGFKNENTYYIVDASFVSKIKGKYINQEFLNKYGYELEIMYPGIIDFIPILEKWT